MQAIVNATWPASPPTLHEDGQSQTSLEGRRNAFLAALCLAALQIAPLDAEPLSDKVKLGADARIGEYIGEDVMIPMRDGVRLHAEIWRPKQQSGKLPILMQRSPYGFGLAAVRSAFRRN